jgi:hypothetical protein
MNYAEGKAFAEQISGVIVFAMMPMMCLRDALHVRTAGEFWLSLASHAVAGTALLLFISIFFLFFRGNSKRKAELIEREEQARQARRALGKKSIIKILLRLYYPASCAGFCGDFLWRSSTSPLNFGHYLVVSFVCATLAILANLATIRYVDRLAEDPLRPNASTTEQLLWLFKGNR